VLPPPENVVEPIAVYPRYAVLGGGVGVGVGVGVSLPVMRYVAKMLHWSAVNVPPFHMEGNEPYGMVI
jgi:hypothetical protein